MTKVFQVTTLASDARELADNITEWTDDQTLANVFEGQCGVISGLCHGPTWLHAVCMSL